jgi:hypothetical protein
MLNRIIILLALTIPLTAVSQEKYLKYDEVEFNTTIERETIKSLLFGEEDYINGFLVLSKEDSSSFEKWKGYYFKEIETLKNRKVSKKLNKDVKFVYDRLHEKFLRKYENMAFFDQIFENGVYNCVTAVALYALSFKELGIPYSIKETPTHVYLIADPESSQLLIETTDPVSGFKTFTPGFKENFVAQLGLMKLVDQNDIASKGIYGVFDEFYFGGADLSLKELIGIQYYNLGYTLFEKKDYSGAWKALTKAQLFHDTDQLNSLLFASIINTLSSNDYSNWNDVLLLPYLERFLDFDIKKTNIVGEFQRMLNYVLVSNNDEKKAEKAYTNYMKKSLDEEVQKEISFSYFYERSIIAYNRANYSKAFDFIINAYKSKPGNSHAENILLESFRRSYKNKPTEVALAKLDTLKANNPSLAKNNHLNTLQLNLYLASMAENFDSKKSVNGNKFMQLFESTISENPNNIYDENILANSYSKAAIYYFKRGYSTKARNIIQVGLKYAPGNYQLKSRLRMLNN